MTQFHIHLISDSTGETVNSVMRSAMSQFDNIDYEEHTWALVRTQGQLQRVCEEISERPGPVLYTIIDRDLQAMLIKFCRRLRLPCIPVITKTIEEFSTYFGVEAKNQTGKQYELDEEYFQKVDAIHYTLAHDDGAETDTLNESDIVLVGASRTSKTPTCVYLAYKGLNAANVPYVKGVDLPEIIFELEKPLMVGLFIQPERLGQIRKSRLTSLHENSNTDYVDMDSIIEEVQESRKIFTRQGWPVIDVTRKSVEETSAQIMQLYSEHCEKNGIPKKHY